MRQKSKKKDYFESSHLTVISCFTIFAAILAGESLLLSWESWALIPIAGAVIVSWIIHVRQLLTANARIWIYSTCIMVMAFFYGIHITSTYDLGLVLSLFMMILISTGIEGLVTQCQVTYYITMTYDVFQMYSAGEVFDSLVITRTLLHYVVITILAYVSRIIIRKWNSIMDKSEDEMEELSEATEKLNDFLANISHEIRTPINAVIGLSSVCLEREKDDDIRENLKAVSEAGRRVGEQISDIQDYSEIEMDSMAVNEENYMISSLLNDIVSEVRPKKTDDVELVIDVDPAVPSVMITDVVKLKKIIKHLVENGLKYTREGGIYVRVTAEQREYGINLQLFVKDTGIGMDKEELEKVTDRFYQADSGRTRSTSGLGLGLSIVNGFTSSLKGFFAIESTPGAGTSVRVSIPQKVVDSSACMSLIDRERLRIGAYLHFEKFENPHVRDFYNAMVKDLVIGLKVEMQRADNIETFEQLCKITHFTHVFVGQDEYEESPEFFDSISMETLVAVVCGNSFSKPKNSNVRIMRKPFYCFPVIAFLNSDVENSSHQEGRLKTYGVRALVVDDEPLNHIVAKEIFTGYGMEVFSAGSGADAITFVEEHDVDIIFMDHMMPGMDGVEAMRRIRSILSRSGKIVPIVALTANAVSTAKEMFIREGFDAFLAKPIEVFELERILRKVLPKSSLTEEEEDADTSEQSVEKLQTDSAVLADYGIDERTGLRYTQNDREFYEQLLLQYAGDAPGKIQNAEKYLQEKDYKNYEILVHSIKSSSKMIGATELSEAALKLEKAAEAGDVATIDANHGDTMDRFKQIAEGILKCLNTEDDSDPEEASGEIMEFDTVSDEADDEENGNVSDSGVMEFDAVMEFEPEGGAQ